MRISEEKLQEITEGIDIVAVLGQYVTLKKQGRNHIGLCPFHNEKTPSFSVDPVKKFYYCFGCQKGGTVFKFLMEMEGLSFPAAAEALAQKAGVTLDLRGGGEEYDDRWRIMKNLYTRVAGSLHYLLKKTPEAAAGRDYLKDRGISQTLIDRFALGWAPAEWFWLFNFLRKKNYSVDFLKESHLFTNKNPRVSFFWNRIVFPIRSASGQVIGFGGRALLDEGPKYINSPESEFFKKRKNLYGLDQAIPEIRKTGEFILTEGYFDVIAFFQGGIERAVAPLGTAFTDEQAKLIRRYATKGILVFDGDEAGIRATMKAILVCEEAGIQVAVAIPSPGEDPADILKKQGAKALHKLLKFTISNFDFLLEKALEKGDANDPEGKETILRSLAPFLERVDSKIRREGMLRKLADILDVDFRSVEADLRGIEKRSETPRELGEKKQTNLSLELYLMMATAVNREQFSYVRRKIQLEDLEDPLARSLYIALEESFRTGKDESHSTFIERIDEEEIRQPLTRKIISGEFEVNSESLIRQSLARVKRESLIRARGALERQLRQRKALGANSSEIQKLLMDKMFMDEGISKFGEF